MRQPLAPGALVTGAARGIGRAIATRLAQRGDSIFIADKDIAEARRTTNQITEAGLVAHAVYLDVTDVDQVRQTIAEIDADTSLQTVVNNAGVGWITRLVDVTPEEFDSLMAVNLRGVFFVLQAAARAMIPRQTGSIINIASTSAFTASTSPMVCYDTSKGAVRMLTKAAARELSAYGIRVNGVAPGTVDTDLTRPLFRAGDVHEELIHNRIPLGRLGETSEIAAAVDFLSSPDASYITGHVLVVDGGWLT